MNCEETATLLQHTHKKGDEGFSPLIFSHHVTDFFPL